MKTAYLRVLAVVVVATLYWATGRVAFAQADDSQQKTSINSLTVVGRNRPESVPADFVVTPFGYFHPSCVRTLAKGDNLLRDGRAVHANGTVDESAPSCSYPHYTKEGVAIKPGSSGPNYLLKSTRPVQANAIEEASSDSINGWVEDESISSGSSTKAYGALVSEWTVPAQPTNQQDGQTIYLFPGFESIITYNGILQPVLGWYQGDGWMIDSANCCFSGVVNYSQYIPVKSGDKIYGSITSSCPAGTLSCSVWNVLTLDLTSGQSTLLQNTPSEGEIYNNAQGGVLEGYSITSCNDFPSDGQITFQTTVFDQNLNVVGNPKWNNGVFGTVYPSEPNATPQCNYSTTGKGKNVTLVY